MWGFTVHKANASQHNLVDTQCISIDLFKILRSLLVNGTVPANTDTPGSFFLQARACTEGFIESRKVTKGCGASVCGWCKLHLAANAAATAGSLSLNRFSFTY